MKRTLLTGLGIVIGAMATFGSAYMGWSAFRSSLVRTVTAAEVGRRVTIGPTRLRYFEGENVLTLAAEMASDREGAYYIVYLPGEARWRRQMPDWCRHRRAEVVTEIKRLTASERIKWVEDGEVAGLPNKVLQADDHLGRSAPSVSRR